MNAILLNRLSTVEYISYRDSFPAYKQAAVSLLRAKNSLIAESTILSQEKAQSMREVCAQYPERFTRSGYGIFEGKKTALWTDLWGNDAIVSTDFMFDLFFAYQLRQLDLLKLDSFLEDNISPPESLRFVALVLRKHRDLLPSTHIETISEFLQKQQNGSETWSQYEKGRPKREKGDKYTLLNQEITALLIHYLQKGQLIFKGDYLTSRQAGQAFSLLTGYSAETLRQSFSPAELKRISCPQNLTSLYNALARLQIFIDKDIKQTTI